MSKSIIIVIGICVALYAGVMGYSLGVIAETDASVSSSFLRDIVRTQPLSFVYAPKTWKVWQDGTVVNGGPAYNGYSVTYPRDFDVYRDDQANGNFIGTPRVKLAFPQDAFQTPKTNYGEAYMTVSFADDSASVKNCFANPLQGGDQPPLTDTETINGITYHTGNVVEPAAGNIYTSQVYRVVQDSRCYEIVLTVHTGNIQNYTPGAVQEFDKTQAFQILDKMLGTFAFTDKNPNF
jgi:hypothetical protein